jgi:hypothetical protein
MHLTGKATLSEALKDLGWTDQAQHTMQAEEAVNLITIIRPNGNVRWRSSCVQGNRRDLTRVDLACTSHALLMRTPTLSWSNWRLRKVSNEMSAHKNAGLHDAFSALRSSNFIYRTTCVALALGNISPTKEVKRKAVSATKRKTKTKAKRGTLACCRVGLRQGVPTSKPPS